MKGENEKINKNNKNNNSVTRSSNDDDNYNDNNNDSNNYFYHFNNLFAELYGSTLREEENWLDLLTTRIKY